MTFLALIGGGVAASFGLGYQDTPLIPGTHWHIHDGTRPQPKVITPGAKPGDAPSDAVVLFDGKDLSKWKSGNGEAKWVVKDGYFECVPKSGYLMTKEGYGPDVQLHVEWAAPNPPDGTDQGRGNSGVFFHGGLYEIQVLDCFENKTYPDGQTSALYGQWPPLVNACRKPGEWQSYDIVFDAPRFEGEQLVKPARATVFHNGVCVHHAREILGATEHRAVATYRAHPAKLPLKLQDHGNPVRFRNIWVRPISDPNSP
jgi:hypothetical protein